MFAHQVIEDLKDCIKINRKDNFNEKNNEYLHLLEVVLELISTSQSFHMGEAQGIWQTRKRNYTSCVYQHPFYDENNSYLMFPYTNTWFDFFLRGKFSTHLGILVSQVKNDNSGSPFYEVYFAVKKTYPEIRWNISPFMLDISNIGCEIKSYLPPWANKDDDGLKEITDWIYRYGTILIRQCGLLLNCKNVVTEIIYPPEKLNIKRRKNGKQELFSYHVLNVTLPSQKQGYREKTDPNYHVRVHLCRGHFKEYTKEHPLFGSLTGRYWWQPQARGNKKLGVVMKDYEVQQRAVA